MRERRDPAVTNSPSVLDIDSTEVVHYHDVNTDDAGDLDDIDDDQSELWM